MVFRYSFVSSAILFRVDFASEAEAAAFATAFDGKNGRLLKRNGNLVPPIAIPLKPRHPPSRGFTFLQAAPIGRIAVEIQQQTS
jgi:hypothetical protein